MSFCHYFNVLSILNISYIYLLSPFLISLIYILYFSFIHLLVTAVMLGPTLSPTDTGSSTRRSSKSVKSSKRERIQSFQLCNIWGKKYYSVLAKNHLRAGGKNLVTKKTLAANPVTGKPVTKKPSSIVRISAFADIGGMSRI